ncbi:MAG TPA: hypothetical protein VJS20_04745 [Gemmatimonadales bacterium]|nr:hypothetical protein [Gemmatimonadales bacterium]
MRSALFRVLAVVLDRAHARVFAVTPTTVSEIADITSPAIRGGRFLSDRHGATGGGERPFHHRPEDESRRHFLDLIRVLTTALVGHPDDELFLAGPGSYATLFERQIPVDLKHRVIGIEEMNPLDATPAVVAAVVRDAKRHHQHQAEQAVMTAVADGVGTGMATNGVPETLHALGHGEVRALIIHPHARCAGFRCLKTGRLAMSRWEYPGEGPAREVADVIRAAAREAVRQGADVIFMQDPTVAGEVDGLAALLRSKEGGRG